VGILNLPAKRVEDALSRGLLLAGIAYMVPFVRRGWVPHDEGMIGQSAERALMGELPHVHFQEAYTGGLTWLYAAVFGVFGIDLLNIRWALFASAVLSVIVLYAILRRSLTPMAAAFGVAVAIPWSFPNYFAGLPSWWVLLCALICLWALLRYFETSSSRYVAIAGLAVGAAVAIKQTGLYLVPPLLMSVWIGSDRTGMTSSRLLPGDRVLRAIVGILLLGGATLLLDSRLWPGELTYLLLPIAASSIAFALTYEDRESRKAPGVWPALCLAGASAALPVALLLVPYLASGHLREFFEGAFILPRRRLAFASTPMPSAWHVTSGVVMALSMAVVPGFVRGAEVRVLQVVRWAAVVFVAFSLSNPGVYQFLWHSLRTILSLSPLMALWLLASDRGAGLGQRRLLFASSSMLAWASLVQFPFSAPIYFCYVAPLGIVVIACASGWGNARSARRLAPLAAMALAFAVLSMNRGYLGSLGVQHAPVKLDAPLRQPRARLTIGLDESAVYRRTVFLVKNHIGGGRLMAGPDSPEIYFLTGQFSPTGAMFDFLDASETAGSSGAEALWLGASVVVINSGPDFSHPLPEGLRSRIRENFPYGERVGPFEVRWR